MGGFRKSFATDEKYEREGIVLDYGDGRKLRIARAGGANKRYQTVLEKVAQPFRRAIEAKAIPAEKSDEILREVFAKSIVLGWEGVTQDDLDGSGSNQPAPFTVDNCIAFLKALPDVFMEVREQAASAALFRSLVDEDAGKNS